MKALQIADFNRFQGEITATTTNDHDYVISEDVFEAFLKRNDLLDWELNSSNERGEHVQTTGQMALDEYFLQDEEITKLDIAAYLASARVKGNIFTAINDIFSTFKRAS